MHLTFEEVINEHRKMWNWIADETERRRECVNKTDYFKENKVLSVYPDIDMAECFCCSYDKQFTDPSCMHCPIMWNESRSVCVNDTSPYTFWTECVHDNDWMGCAEYARQIANLPAKEKEAYNL